MQNTRKSCCDCTWRCPLYDSKHCYNCRFHSEKPNFDAEKHLGYGTNAEQELDTEPECEQK